MLDRTDATSAAYLLETGGLEATKGVYRDRVPTPLWRVRFYVPGKKDEFQVSVDPASGRVVGFSRDLEEDAPGPSIEPDRARALAEAFATAHGQDLAGGELKESTAKDLKARRDHTLVWEYPIAGAAEAKIRYEVVVQGDTVGSWGRGVKIPEAWRRTREEESALTVVLSFLKIPFLGVLAGLAILLLVQKLRSGEVPWKFGLVGGGFAAVAALANSATSFERIWATVYKTEIPEPLFRVTLGIGVLVGAVGFFLAGLLAASAAGALAPASRSVLTARARGVWARDALIAGLIALGFLLGLPALARLAASIVPSGLSITGVALPGEIEASPPALAAIAASVSRAIFLAGLAAALISVLGRYFRNSWARAGLGALLAFAFLPPTARRPGEYLAGMIAVVVVAAGVLLLGRFFLRDNPLAWLWSAWFAFGAGSGLRILEQSAPSYRLNGIVVLVVVAAPALLLIRDALRHRFAPAPGGPPVTA